MMRAVEALAMNRAQSWTIDARLSDIALGRIQSDGSLWLQHGIEQSRRARVPATRASPAGKPRRSAAVGGYVSGAGKQIHRDRCSGSGGLRCRSGLGRLCRIENTLDRYNGHYLQEAKDVLVIAEFAHEHGGLALLEYLSALQEIGRRRSMLTHRLGLRSISSAL